MQPWGILGQSGRKVNILVDQEEKQNLQIELLFDSCLGKVVQFPVREELQTGMGKAVG